MNIVYNYKKFWNIPKINCFDQLLGKYMVNFSKQQQQQCGEIKFWLKHIASGKDNLQP